MSGIYTFHLVDWVPGVCSRLTGVINKKTDVEVKNVYGRNIRGGWCSQICTQVKLMLHLHQTRSKTNLFNYT